MDNSFIKFYNTIADALSLGDLKNTQLIYYTSIQLLPTETYLHITNISGGVSFQGDYKVEAVTTCNTVLADITSNVFIEEFTDGNGDNQCVIEYVNIGQDFFGRAVMLKFTHTISDVIYYTNPIKITSKNEEKTIRFDYSDFEDKEGFGYENAPFKQSIRIYCEYTNPNNKSEVGSYYQISNRNTISNRKLKSRSHSYVCNNIDLHTYNALDSLFNHSEVYIDTQKVTDSPTIAEDERKGHSNLFSATFELFKDEDSAYESSYQVGEGLLVTNYEPTGSYTLASLTDIVELTFNQNITLNTGNVNVYNSSNVLIHTFTEGDFTVIGNNLTATHLTAHVTALGSYYITVDSGLVSGVTDFIGINDMTTWMFVVKDVEYNKLEYNNSEYLTD